MPGLVLSKQDSFLLESVLLHQCANLRQTVSPQKSQNADIVLAKKRFFPRNVILRRVTRLFELKEIYTGFIDIEKACVLSGIYYWLIDL